MARFKVAESGMLLQTTDTHTHEAAAKLVNDTYGTNHTANQVKKRLQQPQSNVDSPVEWAQPPPAPPPRQKAAATVDNTMLQELLRTSNICALTPNG